MNTVRARSHARRLGGHSQVASQPTRQPNRPVATRLWHRWVPTFAGIAVFAAVLVHVGFDAFLAGVTSIELWMVLVALGINVVVVVCATLRWREIARALRIPIGIGYGVGAYYVSQLVNAVVPGGMLGDVYRGAESGHRHGRAGRGIRAVAWDRGLGQVAQIGVVVGVLVVAPWPLRLPVVVRVLGAGLLLFVVVWGLAAPSRRRPIRRVGGATHVGGAAGAGGASHAGGATREYADGRLRTNGRVRRILHAIRLTVSTDTRVILGPRTGRYRIAAASVVTLSGPLALFLIAARAVDSTMSWDHLIPVTFVVLLAAAIPLSAAGWGPRDGAAAAMFAAAGSTAQLGVATAAAFGVLTAISTAPGIVVLLARALRRRNGHRASPAGATPDSA